MGKLRHNKDYSEDVRAEAKKLVDKWKQAVTQNKPKASMAPTRTSTPSQTASPAPPLTPASNKPYEGDITTRDFRKTDKIRYDVTDSTTRNNSMGLMYNGLAFLSKDSIETVTAKATEVEAAAFKHFGGETNDYKLKMRSLFQNLKVRSNSELRRRVMSGEIAAADFIKMSSDELKSQEHKERDKAFEKENMNDAQVPQPEKSVSTALTCGKCHQKKVSYTQAQTRSADEPMTTFCECLNCGHHWKVRHCAWYPDQIPPASCVNADSSLEMAVKKALVQIGKFSALDGCLAICDLVSGRFPGVGIFKRRLVEFRTGRKLSTDTFSSSRRDGGRYTLLFLPLWSPGDDSVWVGGGRIILRRVRTHAGICELAMSAIDRDILGDF